MVPCQAPLQLSVSPSSYRGQCTTGPARECPEMGGSSAVARSLPGTSSYDGLKPRRRWRTFRRARDACSGEASAGSTPGNLDGRWHWRQASRPVGLRSARFKRMRASNARKPPPPAVVVARQVVAGPKVLCHIPGCPISLTLLIRNALRRALVEQVSLTLKPCHSRRVRFSGADIELLSVRAGHVGVHHAQIVDALVDRISRSQAAQWHEPGQTCQYAKGARWRSRSQDGPGEPPHSAHGCAP